jgi:hypothetical protein
LRETEADAVRAIPVFFDDEVTQRRADEVALAVPRDVTGARIGEKELAFAVDDDDTVGRAFEKVGVTLQRFQPALGLETREGDLLGLIAQALENARVAQRDGGRVGDGPEKRELAVSEGEHVPRAQKEHAERLVFEQNGHERERAESRRGKTLAYDFEQGVRSRVADDERFARRHDLADLRILLEVDGQVAQVLVVAGRHDVTDVTLTHEHDAASVDLGDLGDAANDGKKNVAKIEARGQRLRQLEHDLSVALAPFEGLHVIANA